MRPSSDKRPFFDRRRTLYKLYLTNSVRARARVCVCVCVCTIVMLRNIYMSPPQLCALHYVCAKNSQLVHSCEFGAIRHFSVTICEWRDADSGNSPASGAGISLSTWHFNTLQLHCRSCVFSSKFVCIACILVCCWKLLFLEYSLVRTAFV